MIGVLALGGKPVNELVGEIDMSRSYIYEQKSNVSGYIESLDEETKKGMKIEADKAFIKRSVVSLMLNCRSSIEGVQRHFEDVYNMSISVGSISGIMKEASEAAMLFDENVDLSRIKQGASDEIFQGNTPIMVSMDLDSTYAFMLKEATNRSSETWQLYMEECKEQGLELETAIIDGGSGLNAGIPKTFKDVIIQADTFHGLNGVSKEVSKAERQAQGSIKVEGALEERLQGSRVQQKTKDKLKEVKPRTAELINTYDTLFILFTWLRELLSFSGYSLQDTKDLILFVLAEMDMAGSKLPGMAKETQKIRKNMTGLLTFRSRLEKALNECAVQHEIPPDIFRIMYRQMSYGKESNAYWEMEYALWDILKEDYNTARHLFQQQLKKIKKASSMVENLNGRIRSYIEVKRVIPANFFVLMKVYFNLRRYKRSRCEERKGKSPFELLT